MSSSSEERGYPYVVSKIIGNKAVLTPQGFDWISADVQNLQTKADNLKKGDIVLLTEEEINAC